MYQEAIAVLERERHMTQQQLDSYKRRDPQSEDAQQWVPYLARKLMDLKDAIRHLRGEEKSSS